MKKQFNIEHVTDGFCGSLSFGAQTEQAGAACASIVPLRITPKPLRGDDGHIRTTIRIPRIFDEIITEYSRLTNRSKNDLYAIFIGAGLSLYRAEGQELVYITESSRRSPVHADANAAGAGRLAANDTKVIADANAALDAACDVTVDANCDISAGD